ncbi:MAG: TetR/AcrR family transcriptional regulator [Candidatus Dormibacteria bacterium]
MREPVKGKSEAGRRREERATATRERIVRAAIRLFLDRGYAATTVDAIARDAGVAAATVYQAFGTKHEILGAGLDLTIAGDAQLVAVLDRDWVRAARREHDPQRRLVIVLRHATEIAARTAPIKEVMRDAAATEGSIRDLIREDNERRYRTQEALVGVILGDGSPIHPAAATFFALVNSDTFRLLVSQLGWTPTEWRSWLERLLSRELFEVTATIDLISASANSTRGPGPPRGTGKHATRASDSKHMMSKWQPSH